MTDGTGAVPPRHADLETLSAYIDGELSGEDERETAGHVASCPECGELVDRLRAAHDAIAEPVAKLDEHRRSILLANAVAAGAAVDVPAVKPAAAPRRSSSSGWLARAAVILAVGAVAGGVVLVARNSSHGSSSGSESANTGAVGASGQVPSTTSASGAGAGVGSGSSGATPPSAAGPVPPYPPPTPRPVLVFRPILDLRHETCPEPPQAPGDNQPVLVPVSRSQAGSLPICLQLGAAIVEASPPTRFSLSCGAAGSACHVTVALTPGAALVVHHRGVVERSRVGPATPVLVDAWTVVATIGRSIVGEVSEVVRDGAHEPSPYEAVIVGLTDADATAVQAALGG